jgi:hypothetical protein
MAYRQFPSPTSGPGRTWKSPPPFHLPITGGLGRPRVLSHPEEHSHDRKNNFFSQYSQACNPPLRDL